MNYNYSGCLRFLLLIFLWKLSFVSLAATPPEESAFSIVRKSRSATEKGKELWTDLSVVSDYPKKIMDINSVVAARLNQTFSKRSLSREFTGAEGKGTIPPIEERLMTSSAADFARACFKDLDEKNHYLEADQLSGNELTRLPIGIKYDAGDNTSVELAIVKATFYEEHAELSVFLRVTFPGFDGDPTELFMGTTKLTFSYEGGIIEGRMALLGDVAIPLQNMTLVVRGAKDRSTSNFGYITYAEFDCSSFKGIFVSADLEISRDLLLPYDPASGRTLGGKVSGSITTFTRNFNDLFIGFRLSPFAINGFERIGYLVDAATFDFSDRNNPRGILLPEKSRSALPNPDSVNTWRGIYLNEFRVVLPPEFKKKSSEKLTIVEHEIGDPMSQDARHVIIDRTGLTGEIYGANVYGLQEGLASDWRMSLDVIRMKFESNQLVSGLLRGKLVLPTAKDTLGALRYSGIIQKGDSYLLTLANGSKMDFGPGKGMGILTPNSFISLVVENDQFRPVAVLHNRSAIAESGQIKNPGGIPPSSPVFKGYSISAGGVRKKWVNPLDKNVVSVVLVRKSLPSADYINNLVFKDADTSWKVVSTFKRISVDTTYLDTSVLPDRVYAYALIAKDASGLRSVPGIPVVVQTPVTMVLNKGTGTPILTPNYILNRIRLSWKFDSSKTKEVKSFQIYRSEGKGRLVFWKSADSDDRLIDDYRIKNQMEYNYAIRVLFKDGTTSSWENAKMYFAKP